MMFGTGNISLKFMINTKYHVFDWGTVLYIRELYLLSDIY